MESSGDLFGEAVAAQGAGRLAEAAALYERLLSRSPGHAPALNNFGTVLFALGRPAEGLQRYREAVAVDPAFTEALSNLGKALAMTGDWANAVGALLQALQRGSADPDVRNALSSGLRRLAREAAAKQAWSIAADYWQRLSSGLPNDPEALLGLADCHVALGHLEKAVPLYHRALALVPGHGPGWTNLGGVLEASGDLAGAEAAYRNAWASGSASSATAFNLGRLLLRQGGFEEARRVLEAAMASDPHDPDLLLTLAEAQAGTGDVASAEAICLPLTGHSTYSARAWLTLGNIRQGMDRLDAAAEAYERALQIAGDYLPALQNLGSVRMAMGDLDAASEAFERAQRLHFDAGIDFRMALMLPPMVASPTAIKAARKHYQRGLAALRQARLTLTDPLAEVGSTPFYLAYHGVNDRQLQQETAQVYLAACPQLGWTAPHVGATRPPGARIRVGFASAFLRRHTIGRLFGQFIGRLDRDRFEVWVFQTDTSDDMAQSIADSADHAVLLRGDLAAMQEQLAAARLDVLIYPDIGMEPTTYFLAYARLAPVQAVLWGHPMTTGIPNMDYFLSAADMETSHAATHYSETLVPLPSVNTCFRRPSQPADLKGRQELGLPGDGALYVCPQSLFKFHPEFDRACMRLLQQDPSGYLVLIEDSSSRWQENLQERFRAIDAAAAGRVVFVPRLQEADFFALLSCADVVIDPFHFGGGNTSLEAFALGTPVVTLPSDYLRGRITYALYRQMGIDDLIAADAEAWVALAMRVAHDRDWRAALQRRILAASDALFERHEPVAELESFIQSAHAAATQGRRLHPWPETCGTTP